MTTRLLNFSPLVCYPHPSVEWAAGTLHPPLGGTGSIPEEHNYALTSSSSLYSDTILVGLGCHVPHNPLPQPPALALERGWGSPVSLWTTLT